MKIIQLIKNNYLLLAILLLGAVLRLYKLDFQSIWLDEIHTMNESDPSTPFLELNNAIKQGEQMPQLYFYSMYFIFKVLGYTTFIARLFSATIGVLSIYYIFKLGKEIIGEKTGLIAAFLLAINSFHLYYSQDARPYILLVFFTQISFYRLVLFLKENTSKNAIYYGLFTGLMLLTHFFGLFVFLSQLLILGIFLLLTEKSRVGNFFKKACIAGTIAAVIFAPAIGILIKVSQIKEFWIPAPTPDVYTNIYKEFFGNSEMVLALIGIFVLMYFINLSKEKESPFTLESIIEKKHVFSFIVFFPWIFLVLLIPLVKSYLSVPMIISRYFIVLLPVVLLIVAIGINQFKNTFIQICLILLVLLFTLNDIFFVNKYYKQPNKSQFREATEFIIKNNTSKEPIYTTLFWHFNYFFKNKESNVSEKTLDAVISDIKKDTTNLKPFWYINAHGNKYEVSKENELFLNNNFVVDKKFNGYDAWSIRFLPQKMVNQKVDLKKYVPYNKTLYGSKIKAWVESLEQTSDSLKVKGWSILEKVDSKDSHIYAVLLNPKNQKVFFSTPITRPDITSSENNGFNYDNSGFDIKASLKEVDKGTYKLGIYVVNLNADGLYITDKQIVIN